jgi:hypothetical protein
MDERNEVQKKQIEDLEKENATLKRLLRLLNLETPEAGHSLKMYERAYNAMLARAAEKESLLAKLQSSDAFSDPVVKAVVDYLRTELDTANEQITALRRFIEGQN